MNTAADITNQEFELDPDYFLQSDLPVHQTKRSRKDTSSLLASAPTTDPNLWDPRLILDLAVGIDSLDEILLRYDMSEHEFELLSDVQAFRRELALTMKDVRENGVPFASKSRVQAEAYLGVLDRMVYDDQTPASVRLECIRSVVKWGKLEPKEEKQVDTANATQVNINISF